MASIKVYIIEDDFRVANINSDFIKKIEGFEVIGVANTGKEAISFLENTAELPNIILLDVYIPDVTGLELMWEIRNRYQQIDIIMITAAKEIETIEETFRGGILDYIIKPVDFERLKQTFLRYLEKQTLLRSKNEMSQEEIDKLRGLSHYVTSKEEKAVDIPKGIDRITLNKVVSVLEKSNQEGVTAVEVSKLVGTSRSTARRYLEYLVLTNQVKAELKYGDVGRPERRYIYL